MTRNNPTGNCSLNYIDKKEEEKEIKRINGSLISSKPLAEEIFIKRLEKKLNRKLFTLPREVKGVTLI